MKIIISILVIGFSWISLSARTVTDMAGRIVEVPETIEKIFPYDAKTSILLFPLLADKMVATSILPGKKKYTYISARYGTIPEVDVNHVEEVLAMAPQVMIASFYDKKENKEEVEKLANRLSIPVLFIDLSIDKLDLSYLFLGKLFSRETESLQYASFLSTLYHHIEALKKGSKPITVTAYYTLGASGLLTDPSGSKHTEVFDFLNIQNSAKVEIPSGGHAQVNMEQVLLWNPDYIFTSGYRDISSPYQHITTDRKWKSIRAVQNKTVYQVPDKPFAWLDHPPSINRIPGILWLCQIFYGQSEVETRNSILQFYALFYKYNLSATEYESLFQ